MGFHGLFSAPNMKILLHGVPTQHRRIRALGPGEALEWPWIMRGPSCEVVTNKLLQFGT